MKIFKRILYKIFHPPLALTAALILISAVLLFYTFTTGRKEALSAYLGYFLSAYALAVVITYAVSVIHKLLKQLAEHARKKNKYIDEYLSSVHGKMQLSLYISVAINMFYALVKISSGYIYGSLWQGTVGVYYAVLCAMRFLLLYSYDKDAVGKDAAAEYRKYRLCGGMLIALNLVLCAMVSQLVIKGETYTYPGSLIYIAAMYTFYAITAATVNLLRFRKYKSPVLSAAKAISFAAALVSVLSLQTAMLSQFDGTKAMKQRYNAVTGLIICLLILLAAFYMFINSTVKLKKLDKSVL